MATNVTTFMTLVFCKKVVTFSVGSCYICRRLPVNVIKFLHLVEIFFFQTNVTTFLHLPENDENEKFWTKTPFSSKSFLIQWSDLTLAFSGDIPHVGINENGCWKILVHIFADNFTTYLFLFITVFQHFSSIEYKTEKKVLKKLLHFLPPYAKCKKNVR